MTHALVLADGKRRRAPGEFTERKRALKKRAVRHDALLHAVRRSQVSAEPAWVHVDGYWIALRPVAEPGLLNGYSGLCLVRTRRYGLRIAAVTVHNLGYADLYVPGRESVRIGLRSDQLVASIVGYQGPKALLWFPAVACPRDPGQVQSGIAREYAPPQSA